MATERAVSGAGEPVRRLTEDRTLRQAPSRGTGEVEPANKALRANEAQPSKSGEYPSTPQTAETSKEELQSINAALKSLNSELRLKLRRVEEALAAGEQLLRQEKRLVDLASDAIFIWDFDSGIVEWNRGSEELYGYSREEALGRRKEQLLQTALESSFFAEIREQLLREGSWRGELKHRTKDGRGLTVESRIVLETIGARRLALESTRDVTDRKNLEQRQQLLLGELSHRVKNTLTVVQSIAQQTLRRGSSPEEMVERLEGRLMALARAHALLVESDWKGAEFHAIARHQLEPYGADNPERISLEGPQATLPADLATPFGLVLHELATNAAKYGSLSKAKGSVTLRWKLATRNDRPILSVVWEEKGGPQPPKKPKAAGFGTSLINRGIPNTTVKRDLKPAGLICTIELILPGQSAKRTAGRG